MYGFNGKEGDFEVSNNGNTLTFGAREFDSRLARWLSVDPQAFKGPQYSPYNFSFNKPLIFIDRTGEWPGVWTFFLEAEIGAGLGTFALNYVTQSGVVYDEVGTTHFVMHSKICGVTGPGMNKELGRIENLELVEGASVSASVGANYNWGAKTLYGVYQDETGTDVGGIPSPKFKSPPRSTKTGKFAEGIAVGLGFGDDNFTLTLGVGLGVKFTLGIKPDRIESISLTDKQKEMAERTANLPVVNVGTSWMVYNAEYNEETGMMEAFVSVNDIKTGKEVSTGIKIYSNATAQSLKNDNGTYTTEYVSDGIWMSNEYKTAAIKAETQ